MADRIHARLVSIGKADDHLFHRHGRATLRAVVAADNNFFGDSEALDLQRFLHSQLVWNAIQAVLAVAGTHEVTIAFWDDGDLSKVSRLCDVAGWKYEP